MWLRRGRVERAKEEGRGTKEEVEYGLKKLRKRREEA